MITYGISPDMQHLEKKFSQEASSRIGNMQRLRDFLCLSLPSFFAVFNRKNDWIDLTHDGSFKTVSRKQVLFGNYKI